MEYPKCLYLDGDVEKAYEIAADAAEEARLRADGYRNAYEQDAPVRKKKGA